MNRIFCIITLCITLVKGSDEISLYFFDSAQVNDTVVKLGDIARIEGGSNDIRTQLLELKVGESAPPGYSRFINSDNVVQYCILPVARSIRVKNTENKRVRIKTKALKMKVADFKEDILKYLNKKIKWSEGDYQISILDSQETLALYDIPMSVHVEGINTTHPRGNIYIQLKIDQAGRMTSFPVSCRIRVTTLVLVAARSINRDEPVSQEDTELRHMDITHFRYRPFTEMSDILEKSAARSISSGTILHDLLLKKEPAVFKGDLVYIGLKKGAVTVSVPVRARESGTVGERIWVENVNTHKLLQVIIQGKGLAILPTEEAI